MKKIKLNHPLEKQIIDPEGIVLILGFFDGLHLGHQAVIKHAKEIAKKKKLKLAMLTFQRHPALVFSSVHPTSIDYLTTPHQKEALLDQWGLDYLYELNFTSQVAQLSAQAFIDYYLLALNAQVVVGGYDYSFGHGGQAGLAEMEALAKGRFKVCAVSEYKLANEAEVSSTRIRRLLKEGEIKKANRLLARPYEIEGFVIHGQARGRKLGYPTANIYPHTELLIPKIGVYASQTWVQGKWYDSMTSIGYNISFDQQAELSLESHLFAFNQPIYGENVRLRWIEYLRDELKFDSAEGLIQQLKEDEKMSLKILREHARAKD